MKIRRAATADLDAVTALHVESWRAHYRGVLPDEFLDGPVEDHRRTHWQHAFMRSDDHEVILVAEVEGALSGFVSAMPSSDDTYDAYVEHLHVSPGLIGGGIGRQLLAESAERLIAMGHRSAYLLVFSSNQQAIRFYERLGGATRSFGTEDMGGARIPRSRVSWPDLTELATACRATR